MSKQTAKVQWVQRSERGSEFLLRFMAWIALHLGRTASRLILHPISLYFVLSSREARQASRRYLTLALQRPSTWRDFYRHIHCFASVILDRVYFLNGRDDLFDLKIMDDAYTASNCANSGMGVFLMGAHYGSFECVRLAGRSNDKLRFVLLMYEENAAKLLSMMAALNPQAQQEVIPLGKLSSMLKVRDELEQGAMIGILADRSLHESDTLPMSFLGETAHFPAGPWRMAAMLKHPVFLMTGIYRGSNRYEISLEKIADFSNVTQNREQAVKEALALYVSRLEHYCKLAPYNWFNFYDFWKPLSSQDTRK